MSYRGPDERYAEQAAAGSQSLWQIVGDLGRSALDLAGRALDALAPDRPAAHYNLGSAMMQGGVADAAQAPHVRAAAAAMEQNYQRIGSQR